MINQGIVREVRGKVIKVKLFKSEGCSHCSACSEQNKYGKDFEFTTDKKAKVGDLVTLEIAEKDVLKAASIAYVFPPIMMIVGYLLVNKMGYSENLSVLGSFLALGISFVCLYFYDKFFAKKNIEDEIKIISIEPYDKDKIDMQDNCHI